ncbi:MAG: MBL fold metallo-hydrolase [bacterium]|nr:MBL fold metallo-hydrolase [bacterium]
MLARTLLPGVFFVLLLCGTFVKPTHGVPRGPGVLQAGAPREGGTFPATWISGLDCQNDPAIQVHRYNRNLFILRQSMCVDFEAPFMYLIFGREKVLLIDTGSSASSPIAATVDQVIQAWLAANGMSSIELIVAHSHSHGDHVQGDPQFVGMPNTTVVGLGLNAVINFWGFTNWPENTVQYDLGGRVLDVMATPGHQGASISIYDRNTQLLITGDIIYPGHLFVFLFGSPTLDIGWFAFQASLQRLVDFASTNPVTWVVGCHVEMSDMPGVAYPWGTSAHPREHPLQLRPSILTEIRDAAFAMGSNPLCMGFDEFVIHPVYLCGIFWNP